MSRLFDDATNDRLFSGVQPVTVFPVTFACWFKTDTNAINQMLISLAYSVEQRSLDLRVRDVPDADIAAVCNTSAGWGTALSASSYSVDTWHHAGAVFPSIASRYAYLDGVPGPENTDNMVTYPEDLNNAHIGCEHKGGSYSYFMSGSIAEVAIWNAPLTTAEMESLAAGYCPLFVKPESLKRYLPLRQVRGLYNPELIALQEFYDYGSPSMAEHPRIIYPAPRIVGPEPYVGDGAPSVYKFGNLSGRPDRMILPLCG